MPEKENPAEAGPKTLPGGLNPDATRGPGHLAELASLAHPVPFNGLHEARLIGFGEGWDARQPEVDQLNDEADRLWLRQWSPRDRHQMVQARLDQHFVAEDRRFFGGGRR